MDLVRLGVLGDTTYTPDMMVEGYTSLIWTERFQDPGDFELKSFDIKGMKAILPVDTFVSHVETKEVMQVETHEVNMVGEGADQQPELTIRGRSVVNILEHRWVESSYQTKRRMRYPYSATSALCVLLVNAIRNGSGADITRGDDNPDTPGEGNHYPWTTLDVLPNIAITEAVASEGPTRWWHLEQGMLLPQFQKIMVDADLGIRTIRPVSPNPGLFITVSGALANRGTITRTSMPDISQMRFEVYQGFDRSATVQFSQLQGHIDKPTYLSSSRDFKTVVEIMSGYAEVSDVYRPGESTLSGWQRKVTGMDGGTPEIPAAPVPPAPLGRNPTTAERNAYHDALDVWRVRNFNWNNRRAMLVQYFRNEQTAAAQRVLKEMRRVDMFAGDISDLSPYKYKTHYDLGDTVMLHGDYGQSAKMFVSEYVRTEDTNGDRGFPGLVAP